MQCLGDESIYVILFTAGRAVLTLKLIGCDGAQILHEALQIGHLLVELLGGCAGRQSLYLIGRVSH